MLLTPTTVSNGTQKWVFEKGSEVRSSPAVSSDGATVFVGSVDGKVYALHANNGTQKWVFETGVWFVRFSGTMVSSPALSSDGATVFVGSNMKAYAICANNGTQK